MAPKPPPLCRMTFFLLVLESPAQCGMTFYLLDLESGSWNAWMAIFHRPEQRDVSPPHEERDEKVQLLVRSAIYAPERRIEQRCGARALTLHRGRLGVVFWVFFWVFVRFFFLRCCGYAPCTSRKSSSRSRGRPPNRTRGGKCIGVLPYGSRLMLHVWKALRSSHGIDHNSLQFLD